MSGQFVIDQSREKAYIVEWAKAMLANCDIEIIMDPNLHQDYDTTSAWKAIELAMSCVHVSSAERPNMSRVVHELNECLEISEYIRKIRSQDANSMKSVDQNISFNTEMAPAAR